MKRQLQLLAIGVFVTLTGLHAQSSSLRADIPFDFAIGKSAMPAGEYTITCSGSMVAVRQVSGKHYAMVLGTPTLSVPASRHESPAKGLLLFKRYGGEDFLTRG